MNSGNWMAFAGSGLDRAAELRPDATELEALLAQGGTVVPIWRGKPLIKGDASLGWLAKGHPALAKGGAPVFLGLDDGIPRFAQDISDWSPEAGAEAVQSGFFDPSRQHHPALTPDYAFLELRGVMVHLSARDAELVASAKAVLHWHRSHQFCSGCGAPSEPKNAGWQRGCPACGAQHFPRTDPVVIMLVARGDKILLGRSPGWPEGMYSCLAGFVEPGETLEAAVRREVAEETGVTVGAVSYVASQPWPFPASLMFGCEGEALDDVITLDPAELEDALWLGRDDLLRVMAGDHPAVKPARRGSIAYYLLNNWLSRHESS